MKSERYAYCKIKNIAVPNRVKAAVAPEKHIDLISILPTNCIRLSSPAGWCLEICKECYDTN